MRTGKIIKMEKSFKEVTAKILDIAGEKVKWIILFRSYSRNEQRVDSDIDICVYLDAFD